jgi:large conductance mechanosensitive channel
MLREYKAFLLQANLLNLAVAFILGAAFSAVVQSLAEDVIMAPIAGALGFEQVAAWKLGGIAIGSFLAALLSFVVIATVLFVIVRAAARFQGRNMGEASWADTDEIVLLREIRDAIRNQSRPQS